MKLKDLVKFILYLHKKLFCPNEILKQHTLFEIKIIINVLS